MALSEEHVHRFRRTKIVCTLGPATASAGRVRELVEAGMDVARLNFSHGDHDGHLRLIRLVRQAAKRAGREVGILMDLAGPKIRLGELPGPGRRLESGGEVVLVSGETAAGNELPVTYPYLYEDVAKGDRILLADGQVELSVAKKRRGKVYCQVLVGGVVTSRKGVNLPASTLRISTFTEKDRADLVFGLEQGVDMVAMSFVRHERDLAPLREMLDRRDHPPLLIAKIEKPQALERLDSILAVVDGVMVARGDLGVEMPFEEVPLIQKRVIHQARQAGKVVITATQMLRSMMTSPFPSRAEVTDVANAVLDGTDAVMLSDETAAGGYPIEAARVLSRVCLATEPHLDSEDFLWEKPSPLLNRTAAAVSHAATLLARDLKPRLILTATISGSTPRLISRYRPPLPVVGLCPIPGVCRQLCLSFGVVPAPIRTAYTDIDDLIKQATRWAVAQGMAEPGDRLLFTAGLPLYVAGTTNLIQVIEVEPPDQSRSTGSPHSRHRLAPRKRARPQEGQR
jgi:pyruvate kinase